MGLGRAGLEIGEPVANTAGDIELKVSGFVDQTIAHKAAEIFAGSGQLVSWAP